MSELVWAARADTHAMASHIASVICARGRRSIALPGGRTPGPLFEELRRRSLPWGKTRISLTDDRLVPESHPASNFGLLSRFFDATAAQVAPLSEHEAPPRFDLVCVGVGLDGSVASLFPNMPFDRTAAPATIRVTPDPLPADAPFERLSLNIPALARTDHLMVIAHGRAKRDIIDRALSGDERLPLCHLVRQAEGRTTIFWSLRDDQSARKAG